MLAAKFGVVRGGGFGFCETFFARFLIWGIVG